MTDLLPLLLAIVLCALALTLRHLIFGRFVAGMLGLGRKTASEGRTDKAIRLFSSVLTADRTNPDANWALANIYLAQKQYVLARMYLSDILRHGRFGGDAAEEEIHELLAEVFSRLGEFDRAAAEYLILRKRFDLPARILKQAGRMDLQCGRAREANGFITEGIARFPEDGEFRYLAALSAFNRADLHSVEPELEQARRLGFEGPEAELLAARLGFVRGNFQASLEHLQRLPADLLDSAEIENMLGQCFFHLKDYSPAIGVLERLVPELERSGAASLADAMFILGCSYEASGDLPRAMKCWLGIIRRFPGYRNAVQKTHFYEQIAVEPEVRDLILKPGQEFNKACVELLDRIGYTILKFYQASEKSIDFLCTWRRDLHPSHAWLVSVTRQTTPVTIENASQLLRQANNLRARYLAIIAPWFSPDTLVFCRRNLITVNTFTVFIAPAAAPAPG